MQFRFKHGFQAACALALLFTPLRNPATAAAPADNVEVIEIAVHPLLLPGRVVLTWSTATEAENVGFNVYRAEPDGQGGRTPGEKLTTAPVPAVVPGDLGGDYEFVDEQVGGMERLQRAYYVEQVDTDGETTLHGPVSFGSVNTSVEDWGEY